MAGKNAMCTGRFSLRHAGHMRRRFSSAAPAAAAAEGGGEEKTHWNYRVFQAVSGSIALAIPPTVILAYMWNTDDDFGDRLEVNYAGVAARLERWFPRLPHPPFALPIDFAMEPAAIETLGRLFLALDRDGLREDRQRSRAGSAWARRGVSREQCAIVAEELGYSENRSIALRCFVHDRAAWSALSRPTSSGGALPSLVNRVLSPSPSSAALAGEEEEEGGLDAEEAGLATVDEFVILIAALRDELGESDEQVLARVRHCALASSLVNAERSDAEARGAAEPLYLLKRMKELVVVRDARKQGGATDALGTVGAIQGTVTVGGFDPSTTENLSALTRGAAGWGHGAADGAAGGSNAQKRGVDDGAIELIELELKSAEAELARLRARSDSDVSIPARIRDYEAQIRELLDEVADAKRAQR